MAQGETWNKIKGKRTGVEEGERVESKKGGWKIETGIDPGKKKGKNPGKNADAKGVETIGLPATEGKE